MEIIVLRMFLQFVNTRRSEESSEWKKQLNPNYTTWVLKYYYILGNSSALLVFSFITTMIEVTITVFIVILYGFPFNEQNFNTVYHIVINISVAVWVCRFALIFLCVCKMGNFVDYWDIRKEFKYLLIMLAIFMGLGMTVVTVAKHYGFIQSTFTYITSGAWTIYSWYITTIWVIKRNKAKLNANKYGAMKKIQKPKLLDIIETNDGYKLLMNHLKSEFAMENLLFLTHMIQWQDFLISIGLINVNHEINKIKFKNMKNCKDNEYRSTNASICRDKHGQTKTTSVMSNTDIDIACNVSDTVAGCGTVSGMLDSTTPLRLPKLIFARKINLPDSVPLLPIWDQLRKTVTLAIQTKFIDKLSCCPLSVCNLL